MSTYEISKSSLLSLKAEILKKQDEIKKSKAEGKAHISEPSSKKSKQLKLKSNHGVDERQARDFGDEDEDLLKKSRAVLEAKTKLYDKLAKSGGRDNIEGDADQPYSYLVRFHEKTRMPECPDFSNEPDDVARYPDESVGNDADDRPADHYSDPENEDEHWTEYVDSLGRTRKCLRKDLPLMKAKDKKFGLRESRKLRSRSRSRTRSRSRSKSKEKEGVESQDPEEKLFAKSSELISTDMRRELLRQEWEKEETELSKKDNIHYQDILFSEARTHGVGYYGFSRDEELRAKEQAELNKLRNETIRKQDEAQKQKGTRERQLKLRMRAATNRKRARMGLPPVTSDDEREEEEKAKALAADAEAATAAPAPPAKSEEELKLEKKREFQRKNHIRPWDIGKDGVKKERHVYSQGEWIEKKRKERPTEFAPPTSAPSSNKSGSTNTCDIDTSRPPPEIRRGSFRPKTESDVPVRQERDFRGATTTEAQFTPTPIQNELSDDDSDSSSDDGSGGDRLMRDFMSMGAMESSGGVGAEVPPPPTYEYYGPERKQRHGTPGSVDMADSIMSGLRFLREQAEQRRVNRADSRSNINM